MHFMAYLCSIYAVYMQFYAVLFSNYAFYAVFLRFCEARVYAVFTLFSTLFLCKYFAVDGNSCSFCAVFMQFYAVYAYKKNEIPILKQQ